MFRGMLYTYFGHCLEPLLTAWTECTVLYAVCCILALAQQHFVREGCCCFLCTGRFLLLNEPKVKNALPWKGDRRMVGP